MGKIGTKSIKWYGYSFLDNGTVLNKDGTVKKFKYNKKGYPFTNFYIEGKCKSFLVHKLFAMLYLGECPEGKEVDHIDNNRANTSPSNLRYVTKSENNKKSYESCNRNVKGFNNANNKYDKDTLLNAKKLLDSGKSYTEVSKITNIGKGTIARIANGAHFICRWYPLEKQ